MIAPYPYDSLRSDPTEGTAVYESTVSPTYDPAPLPPPTETTSPTTEPVPTDPTPTAPAGGSGGVDVGGGVFMPGGSAGGGGSSGGWTLPRGGTSLTPAAPARDLSGWVDILKNAPGYALALLIGVALVLILIRAS